MFPTVQLQPADVASALKTLGLRIQHKKRCDFFDQPCSAFKNSICSIYEERPVRCRAFQCQQLKRLAQGEITEEAVLNNIREARRKIDFVKKLLYRLGPTNIRKPLFQQYQQIVANPADSSAGKKIVEDRVQLDASFSNLNDYLKQEFHCA
jgi:hypothetical protein